MSNNNLKFNRPASSIDNVTGLDGNHKPLYKKPGKISAKLREHRYGIALSALTTLGAGLLVHAAATDPSAPHQKPEHNFSQDISQDETRLVTVVEGANPQALVQSVYAEAHDGMPGPARLGDGPVLVAAADYVNQHGTPTGKLPDGTMGYTLESGHTYPVPIVTTQQAVTNARLHDGQK